MMVSDENKPGFFSELRRRNVIRVATAYIVVAWLIIQVVETLFPVFEFSDAAIRVVVIVLAIGFLPCVVLSWIFEITPKGLRREVDVSREQSITRFTGKKIDRVIMVLLVLALGYLAFDKFVLEPVRDAELVEETAQQARSDALVESYGDSSIAVLPFVNMSDDTSNEYFSDGVSAELLNLLAKTPELRVISRSSSFSFKGKDVAIPTVAEQLNVAYVLEGSVRKAGDRVRISAQLIEARSDTQLWSDSYDREFDDIFTIQDEIASAISNALRLKLVLPVSDTILPTAIKAANSGAYEAYLRGRELIYRRTNDDLNDAYDHFRRSLRLDENFAPAHAQLAIAMMQSRRGSLESVVEHLDRAQALAPDLAEAHGGRALLELQTTRDQLATVEHARKALASNPSYTDAMNWLQIALQALGRYQESDTTLERMLLIDPMNIVGRYNYAVRLGMQGRIKEAHEMANQLVAQSPRMGYAAHSDVSINYEGRISDGLRWCFKSGPDNVYIIRAFNFIGEYDEARRIDEELNHWVDAAEGRYDKLVQATSEAHQIPNPHEPVLARAAVARYKAGQIDEALPLFERAYEFAQEGQPFLGPLHNHKMVWLALARRQAGDEDGAQEATFIARQDIAARRAAGRKNHVLDQVEAMLAAFNHDPEGVIKALNSAIEQGLRDRQLFEDQVFEAYRDEPRFVALQEELDLILNEERASALQLICFNNPIPDNWQPLPETCEGVDNL